MLSTSLGVGRPRDQRAAHLQRRPGQAARAARRHHQGQALHALRMARREVLRDHAAHRRAADVRAARCRARRARRRCRRPCRRACRRSSRAGRARSAANRARGWARRAWSKLWLRPMSRLSKRITRKPRATSAATKSSCQATSCMPRPMIEQQRLAVAASRGPRPRARCRWPRSASGRRVQAELAAAPASRRAAVRKNQRRAPVASNGLHWPVGCARRSATAYSASGFMPMPTWLACTSMFSASGPASFRLQRQATMPSLRE